MTRALRLLRIMLLLIAAIESACGIGAHIIEAAEPSRIQPCRIQIVDGESKWPVPLVELRTTDQRRWVSDNAGVIAFDCAEAMGQETWFQVRGHGYGVPADGFGYEGMKLIPTAGGTLTISVQRRILARRIGRMTGAGQFGESRKLGDRCPPEIAPHLIGCDSVQNAVHKDRLFWFWGDTTIRKYPLGIFHASGAQTPIAAVHSNERSPGPPREPLMQPPLSVAFEYWKDLDGSPRSVASMVGQNPTHGPTWLTAVVSLPDSAGMPRLVASYMKVEPPLSIYEWGLATWNEETEQFSREKVLWTKTSDAPIAPPHPDGHAVLYTDELGMPWVLFGNPLPRLKCPATYEAWRDPQQWVSLEPTASMPTSGDKQRTIQPHSGSIAWNAYRDRWVTVFMEQFGSPSAFGEVWFAEATSPFGPWGNAVKILSHDNYSFYNPKIHPYFSVAGSPQLYFEGTYAATFANHAEPTPGFDYNQILYCIDLNDSRLAIP